MQKKKKKRHHGENDQSLMTSTLSVSNVSFSERLCNSQCVDFLEEENKNCKTLEFLSGVCSGGNGRPAATLGGV